MPPIGIIYVLMFDDCCFYRRNLYFIRNATFCQLKSTILCKKLTRRAQILQDSVDQAL